MSGAELLGFGIAVGITLFVAAGVALTRMSGRMKRLIYAALGLRVVGSVLRYGILFGFYGGSGDALGYYDWGLDFAQRFLRFDFSPFYDRTLWLRPAKLIGTSFVPFPSSVVLMGIGPSLLGEFLMFSLLAFLGLVGFAVAFRRAYPHIPLTNYARWIWLFPSLWYWPSSVGKDALVLMGIGLAVAGFIGKRARINWLLMIVGIYFVVSIRPQVAAVVILSFVLAHWLSLGSRWTVRRTLQGALILGVGLGGIWLSMTYIGVDGFDIDGVQRYMESEAAGAAPGGSSVEGVGVGLVGVPAAILNILVRPFVWEARNIMALTSAVEILGFWGIAWYRRKNLLQALRTWRSHPLLRLAIPFIIVYSASLGMLVVNLGIIARQRIFLFPFLFLLLEAAPAIQPNRSRPRSGVAGRNNAGSGSAELADRRP